jgi:hypothetical protein
MNGETGKGSAYRPVNQEKYDRNYFRIFGVPCPLCKGAGCAMCNNLGFIRKESDGTGQPGSSAV